MERSKRKIEKSIAKTTYIKSRNLRKVFCQRADLKWHRYGPEPEVDTIENFIEVVEHDDYACFFGYIT